MLNKRDTLFINLIQGVDIIVVGFSFVFSYYIKKYLLPSEIVGLSTSPDYYFLLLLSLVILHYSFKTVGLYDLADQNKFGRLFVKIIKAVFMGILFFGLTLFFLKIVDFSRIMFLIFSINTFILMTVCRYLSILVHDYFIKKGYNESNILIIGSKERARKLLSAIDKYSERHFKIIGCLEIDGDLVGTKVHSGSNVEVIAHLDDFRKVIDNRPVDEIIFAMPLQNIPDIRGSIAYAEELGINIYIMPDWQIHKVMYRSKAATVSYDEFVGLPAISLSSTPPDGIELQLKSYIDYCFAFFGIVVLSPLFILLAAIVKLSSPGPVLFSQVRAGVNGRKFKMYKFRTMLTGAQEMRDSLISSNEMEGPVFKISSDPRVTWIGKLLRKTSLDELPQFFNVLQGHMSIVGPRPPIPSEVDNYKFWQRRRLSMKPGLTCSWQVKNRNDSDFERWMKMDLEYIDNWSLWLDVKLILLTIPVMILGTGK